MEHLDLSGLKVQVEDAERFRRSEGFMTHIKLFYREDLDIEFMSTESIIYMEDATNLMTLVAGIKRYDLICMRNISRNFMLLVIL